MMLIKKISVIFIKQLDYGSSIAIRLTKILGKSKTGVHPKHYLTQNPWFIKYLNKEDVICDLGAGNGQNSIKSAKHVKKIFALEIDESLIKIAKITARAKKIKNIYFEKCNLEEKIPKKDNVFDKVIFLDVLEHLKNRNKVLQEVKRILKSDGFLALGVPNKDTSWKKLQRDVGICSFSDPDHKIEYSEKQIRKLFKKHGFEIIYFGYGKFDTPLRGLIDVVGALSLPIYKKITNWRQKKANKNPKEASGFEIVAKNIK